jgi:hypothetical protein
MNETSVKRLMGGLPRSRQISKYAHVAWEDARQSLLEAEGDKGPSREQMERVTVVSEGFLPLVPVIPSETVLAPESLAATEKNAKDPAALLQPPNVAEFLARELPQGERGAEAAPPASAKRPSESRGTVGAGPSVNRLPACPLALELGGANGSLGPGTALPRPISQHILRWTCRVRLFFPLLEGGCRGVVRARPLIGR